MKAKWKSQDFKINKEIFVTRSSMPTYEEYIEAIKPLWDTHWLTNMGTYHKQLENELRIYLKVPEVSLTVNGHMALELALQAFGFPKDAEVITTPLTFISTTHAIVRNGLTPVFCDVKPDDGTIDETKIEDLITEKTAAIIPVHVYGHVCNVEEIQRIAEKYNIKVIYDAAHAFGVEYGGRGIGAYGDASVFSFHATKVFHAVEGGAVTFSDHKIYEKLYNLKNFGIRGEELVTEVGANAKMNEFCAIMGLCNLRHIDRAMQERKRIVERYIKLLSEIEGLKILGGNEKATKNYAYFPILVTDTYKSNRDKIYEKLKEHGVHARKYFFPVTSDQACFKNKYKGINIPCARQLAGQVLTLPLYEGLSDEDVDMITNIF